MKFEVSRSSLSRAIQLVTGVVERRQTLPILSNVRLVADGNSVTLTGTDLELEMSARVALDHPVAMGGETTLPARKLADIWKSLPDGAQVSVTIDGDKATIRSGRSRFTLATRPANEFPSFDATDASVNASLPRAEVLQLINRTSFSMAQQDVRYFLNGLLLELTADYVRAVTTDGHRLAMYTLDHGVRGVTKLQAIVPRKAVHEIARLLAEDVEAVQLVLGSSFLRVESGEFALTTKLVDGKFPDYEKVIPIGGTKTAQGERDALRQAFTRAAIMSNEKYRRVSLVMDDGALTIHANNPEQEEAEEVVEVTTQGEGLSIGFNVGYLQDVLNAMPGDQVRFCFIDSNSSALIDSPDDASCTYVVMPMRL